MRLIRSVLSSLAILAAFFLGCLVSGALIRQSSLRLGRRYGVALSVESALLLAAVYFLRRGANTGDYLAAAACGLQNAMVSTYSGSCENRPRSWSAGSWTPTFRIWRQRIRCRR